MRTIPKPLRVGIVGCGRAARELHLPALRRLRDVQVVAAADIDAHALRGVADHFRIPRRYTDYRKLLEDREVDAVAVCVPPHLKAGLAILVLQVEKHLFIEKPLALNTADCDRVLRQAKQSGPKAMVGHNLRWHPLVRQAGEILGAGGLGELILARTAMSMPTPMNYGQQRAPHPMLIEFAVHHFDLWRALFRAEVEEVMATCRVFPAGEVAAVTARLSTGLLVTGAFCDFTPKTNEVEVYGGRARLRFSCLQWDSLQVSSATAGAPRERLSAFLAKLPGLPHAAWQALPRNGGIFYESYRAEWQHFADCIHRDLPVEASLEDGRQAVLVAEAALRSADQARPVQLGHLQTA